MERIKIDAFRDRIDAYVASMGAEKVKVKLYTAEKVKAQTFAEQVRAYTAQVEATKVKSDVNLNTLEAHYKRNLLNIEQYKGELPPGPLIKGSFLSKREKG